MTYPAMLAESIAWLLDFPSVAAGLLAGVIVDRLFRRFIEERPVFDVRFLCGDELGHPYIAFEVLNRGLCDWPEIELVLRGKCGGTAALFPATGSSALVRGQTCQFKHSRISDATTWIRETLTRDLDHELQIRIVRSERVLFRSRRIGKRLMEILVAGPGDHGYLPITFDDFNSNLVYRTWRWQWAWHREQKEMNRLANTKKGE